MSRKRIDTREVARLIAGGSRVTFHLLDERGQREGQVTAEQEGLYLVVTLRRLEADAALAGARMLAGMAKEAAGRAGSVEIEVRSPSLMRPFREVS